MHFKRVYYAIGIISQIVSIVTLPIASPNGLQVIVHPSRCDRKGISARSPEDIMPAEECKRALLAASIFDEALHRRCAGEGEIEESGADGDIEEGGDSDSDVGYNNDGDAVPPTPNSAPVVTPVPAPVPPQPIPAPAPAQVPPPPHKPVPVDAGGPARAIPKRVIKDSRSGRIIGSESIP